MTSPDTNLHLAPPVRIVDGRPAVPIDIQQLTADLVFDLDAERASVDAEMRFVLGNDDGYPYFDLRQTIQQAYLDGAALAPADLAHRDFGGGANADLRLLDQMLASGSEHTLRLLYELGLPQAPQALPIGWDGPRLSFDFWFSDLSPGRYLEMWFPANLIFDQFPFLLNLRLLNTSIDHVLISNGAVTAIDASNQWRIEFPPYFVSCSPMLVIAAADRVEQRTGSVTPPGPAQPIALETSKHPAVPLDLAIVEANTAGFIGGNVANVGPYLHGNRFTTLLWNRTRAMEYAGGTTANHSALEHEVFHSWFARGITPASQNDGWLDEAWTVYSTGEDRFSVIPLGSSRSATTLSPRNLFNRSTPNQSYFMGFTLFAGIAAEMGLAALKAAMSDFYLP